MTKCCYEIKNFTGFKHFYEEDDIDCGEVIKDLVAEGKGQAIWSCDCVYEQEFSSLEKAMKVLNELKQTTTWKDLCITMIPIGADGNYEFENESFVIITEFMKLCLEKLATELENNGWGDVADDVYALLTTIEPENKEQVISFDRVD
jgi:hypothetical protein